MTPDLASQHVEGLRIFSLNPQSLLLESLNKRYGSVWQPGAIETSVCGLMPAAHKKNGHTKPEIDCTCGIWSCKNRKGLAIAFPVISAYMHKYPQFVSARIEQWGIVIEHETGYRSEYARIIPESIQAFPRNILNKRYDRVIKYLREKYDPRPR